MNYWLMKSEPTCYSIDDLKNAPTQTTHWDGVRNYQARNMMRDQMQRGDLIFFYHSNSTPPGIVGMIEVCRSAYPDHTALDPNDDHYDPKSTVENPRWFMVDVKFKKKFNHVIPLEKLKKYVELDGMQLLKKGNRLSITPVAKEHWDFIMSLNRD